MRGALLSSDQCGSREKAKEPPTFRDGNREEKHGSNDALNIRFTLLTYFLFIYFIFESP